MNTALSDCAQCWSTYFRRRLHGWHANLGSILGKGLFLSELKKKMIDLNELKARYPKVYDAIDYWKDNYQSFEHDFSAEQILKEAGFFDMNFNHFYEGVIGAENGTKNATLSSKLVG
jgi:predicted adenine nucleotide alpha hydrolase (AANH) superfamily ATPase